jgi:Flp pilus assembly protein TadG
MRSLFNPKAQSIVEITLMTPLLLIALYVPFDFGMSIFAGHLTQNAVRDGARIVSRTRTLNNLTAPDLANKIFANLPQLLANPNKNVTVNYYADGFLGCAQFVEVTARGTYNFTLYKLIRLIGLTPPNTMEITRTTRMHYEFQPYSNGGTTASPTFCSTVTPTASGTYPAP